MGLQSWKVALSIIFSIILIMDERVGKLWEQQPWMA